MVNYIYNQVLSTEWNECEERNLFKTGLNNFFSFENFFKFAGKWLYSFIPVKYTPFWNTLSLHNGECKFVLHLGLMLCISWFVVNKSLFFTTKCSVVSIYWDIKGKISNL